jgi:hypothetical protein
MPMGGKPARSRVLRAVKMAGYTAAGYQFRRMLRASRPNAFAFERGDSRGNRRGGSLSSL